MSDDYFELVTEKYNVIEQDYFANCSIYTNPHRPSKLAMIIAACVSSISVILGIIMWITLKRMSRSEEGSELRPGSRRLLTALTMADVLRAIFCVLGVIRYLYNNSSSQSINCNPSYYCMILSFSSIWFNLSTYAWTLAIGIYFSLPNSRARRSARQRRFDSVWTTLNFVCWVLPLMPAMFCFTYGALGENESLTANGACWITSCMHEKLQIGWMAFTSKGWEFIISVAIVAIYISAKFRLIIKNRRDRYNLRPNRFDNYGSLSGTYSTHSSNTPQTSDSECRQEEVRRPSLHRSQMQKGYRLRRPFMSESREESLFFILILFLYIGRCFGFFRFILNIFRVFCWGDQKTIQIVNFDVLIYFQNFGDNSQASMNFFVFILYCVQARELIFGMFRRQSDIMEPLDD